MKPLYYRYVYSPTTGDVDLSHNQEGHHSLVPTHGEMALSRPESDLLTGYAYRLDGGWRILDADHRPVNDPHIIARVIANVAQAENFKFNDVRAREASQGGPTQMPCPVCLEIGCDKCEVPMGYIPHTSKVHYGKLV